MAQQQNPQQNAAAETEQDILKKIRMDKLAELQAAGNDPFTITKYDVTAHAADLKADYEATEARLKEAANGDEEAFQASLEPLKEQIVSIAGRIMSWRDMGRANFIDVRDGSDRIQVYVRMNDIGGKEAFKELGHRRYCRRQGLCIPDEEGRNFHSCTGNYPAFQGTVAVAGKVARSERPGYPLPEAVSGFDCQSRGEEHLCDQKQDSAGNPELFGWYRLCRSRNTSSAAVANCRCSKTVCDPSQYTGYGYVPAD